MRYHGTDVSWRHTDDADEVGDGGADCAVRLEAQDVGIPLEDSWNVLAVDVEAAEGLDDGGEVDSNGGVEARGVGADEGGEAGARDAELLEVGEHGDDVLPKGAGEEERVIGEVVGGEAETEEEVEALLEHLERGGELDGLELAGGVGHARGAEEVERQHAGDEALLAPLDHAPRHGRHLVLRRRGGGGRPRGGEPREEGALARGRRRAEAPKRAGEGKHG